METQKFQSFDLCNLESLFLETLIHFITSRTGKISQITVYRYDYSMHLTVQAKRSLKDWLTYGCEGQVLLIEDKYFLTFEKFKKSKQFRLIKAIRLLPPFINTQEVSSYLSRHILRILKSHYKPLTGKNSVITEKVVIDDFIILKCIRFSVKVFSSGRCYIHFFPHSQIVSPENINPLYLESLKQKLNPSQTDIWLTIRSYRSHFIRTRDISCDEGFQNMLKFVTENQNDNLYATFNYRTLAALDSEIFEQIQKHTENIITKKLGFIKAVSSAVISNLIEMNLKPFYRYSENYIKLRPNLLVGNNKVASKQSAAYFQGMYRGVDNLKIQPILVGDYNEVEWGKAKSKFERYNGIENTTVFLTPLKITNLDEDFELPLPVSSLQSDTICAIFSHEQFNDILLEKLVEGYVHFEIYNGKVENYKIDNFVVQCITKMGGTLSILNNINTSRNTYFVGIDLGHSHDGSILGLSLISNRGELLYSHTANCARNEVIDPFALKTLVNELYEFILEHNLPKPREVIIHRDGRIHKHEANRLIDIFM